MTGQVLKINDTRNREVLGDGGEEETERNPQQFLPTLCYYVMMSVNFTFSFRSHQNFGLLHKIWYESKRLQHNTEVTARVSVADNPCLCSEATLTSYSNSSL